MTLYTLALFAHIVGAILLFGTIAVEGIAHLLMRRARLVSEATTATTLLEINRVIGPISAACVLIPGFYMTVVSWGAKAWILSSLVAYVLIAASGAASGVRLVRMARGLSGEGPLTGELALRLRDPLPLASWWLRAGLATGTVFLMTVKPGLAGAIATLVVAAAAGVAVGFPAWRAEARKEVAA